MLDFLGDDTKVLTFGGGSTVTITWNVKQTKTVSQKSKYESMQSDQYDINSNFCFSIGRRERNRRLLAAASPIFARRVLDRGLHDRRLLSAEGDDKGDGFIDLDDLTRQLNPPLKRHARRNLLEEVEEPEGEEAPKCRRRLFDVGIAFKSVEEGLIDVSLGRAAKRDKGATHTVSFELSDPDPDDFFAVRVASDPVYATPIFETLGGMSTCPGETATTKRDSRVTLGPNLAAAIDYNRCETPLCQNEPYGSTITLGIVIQNLSPQGTVEFGDRNLPIYRLFVGSSLGQWDANGTDYCGTPGNAAGLSGLVTGLGLRIEPSYGQSEILVHLDHTTTCLEFKQIQVKIIAECEHLTPTYQYAFFSCLCLLFARCPSPL